MHIIWFACSEMCGTAGDGDGNGHWTWMKYYVYENNEQTEASANRQKYLNIYET